MADSVTEARRRQIARPGGAKPPAARKAMALAKSKAWQDWGRRRGDTAGVRD
nr:hypothetical protein [uncultured Rhodopila sp.]